MTDPAYFDNTIKGLLMKWYTDLVAAERGEYTPRYIYFASAVSARRTFRNRLHFGCICSSRMCYFQFTVAYCRIYSTTAKRSPSIRLQLEVKQSRGESKQRAELDAIIANNPRPLRCFLGLLHGNFTTVPTVCCLLRL